MADTQWHRLLKQELTEAGFEFKRFSGNGHEVWMLGRYMATLAAKHPTEDTRLRENQIAQVRRTIAAAKSDEHVKKILAKRAAVSVTAAISNGNKKKESLPPDPAISQTIDRLDPYPYKCGYPPCTMAFKLPQNKGRHETAIHGKKPGAKAEKMKQARVTARLKKHGSAEIDPHLDQKPAGSVELLPNNKEELVQLARDLRDVMVGMKEMIDQMVRLAEHSGKTVESTRFLVLRIEQRMKE